MGYEEIAKYMANGELVKKKLLACNEYTKKFGVVLSDQEAALLVTERKASLKEEGRIEFGEGILSKLIYAFCDSPFIYQDNYTDTISSLQRIFYLYKNESLDEVTDDELIAFMKEQFDGVCKGSLDYLEDTSLEAFAREVRNGTRRFIGRYKDEQDDGI